MPNWCPVLGEGKFTLEHAMQAQRSSRCTALLFNLSFGCDRVVSAMPASVSPGNWCHEPDESCSGPSLNSIRCVLILSPNVQAFVVVSFLSPSKPLIYLSSPHMYHVPCQSWLMTHDLFEYKSWSFGCNFLQSVVFSLFSAPYLWMTSVCVYIMHFNLVINLISNYLPIPHGSFMFLTCFEVIIFSCSWDSTIGQVNRYYQIPPSFDTHMM